MANTHDEHALAHPVALKFLFATWVSLMVLTVVTVAVAGVNLGPLNVPIALAIATVKATIVALFFMHLRWDKPFHSVVLIGSLLFAAIFISFAMMDSGHYQDDIAPADVTLEAPGG